MSKPMNFEGWSNEDRQKFSHLASDLFFVKHRNHKGDLYLIEDIQYLQEQINQLKEKYKK